MAFCEFCNTWITQPKGKKKKRFCNNTCRSNFWYAKNKKGDGKIMFVSPTPESYDGEKMNPINDEMGQWESPLSFANIAQEIEHGLPSYEQLEVKVSKAVFADDKQDLITEISRYTHLDKKKQQKLIDHLKNSR